MGASFLFPKGSGKNLCPSPKQAPLTRKLRPASLARDQETLQAVRRCLPKRGACRQEWEVWGGGQVPRRRGLASPFRVLQSLPGHSAGRPRAPVVGEGTGCEPRPRGLCSRAKVSRLAGPRSRRRLQLWNAVPSRRRRGVTPWTAASKARSLPRSQVPRTREEGQLVDWEGCAARRTPLRGEGVRSPRQEGARRGGGVLRATAPA